MTVDVSGYDVIDFCVSFTLCLLLWGMVWYWYGISRADFKSESPAPVFLTHTHTQIHTHTQTIYLTIHVPLTHPPSSIITRGLTPIMAYSYVCVCVCVCACVCMSVCA